MRNILLGHIATIRNQKVKCMINIYMIRHKSFLFYLLVSSKCPEHGLMIFKQCLSMSLSVSLCVTKLLWALYLKTNVQNFT